MNHSRRRFFMNSLFGAGSVGLHALATGLPLGLIAAPRRASAAPSCTGATSPQYFVLVTSGSGDPLNANVPGTYEDASVYHPASLTTGTMTFGSRTVTAATPWSGLDPSVLARTSFMHHGTYTNAHGDAPKVNKLMGAIMRQEMLCSLIAANTAPCLGTVQTQPVVLTNNLVMFQGSVLPVLSPKALKAVLAAPDNMGPLTQLQKLRDTKLDELNALFKQTGNTNGKAMLDQYALSQTQVRSVSQQLLADLGAITGSTPADLATATAVLFKMNVSSVAVLTLSFGGDNHSDNALTNEATQTTNSVNALFSTTDTTSFYSRLKSYTVGTTSTTLWDSTTIALQNVFGRTLNMAAHSGNGNGRNHNADHHCTVLVGSKVKSSLIGGITPNNSGSDFRATGFSSTDGSSNDGGDVTYTQTLAAVGYTVARACGVTDSVLTTQIPTGKAITAALTP